MRDNESARTSCKSWETNTGQNQLCCLGGKRHWTKAYKIVVLCGVSETGSLTQVKIPLSLRSESFSRLYFVIFNIAISRAHTHCYTSSCAGQEVLMGYSWSKQTENVDTKVLRYFEKAIGMLDSSVCSLFNHHCSVPC